MSFWPVFARYRENTMRLPSGDQPGSNAKERPGPVCSWIGCRPLPSGWTTYSPPWLLPVRIHCPSGDQLAPAKSSPGCHPLTWCRPLPLTLTTNRAICCRLGLLCPNTILVPFGDESPGTSFPPLGLAVTITMSPPFEERTVKIPRVLSV